MAGTEAIKLVSLPQGESLVGDFAEVLKINATGQVIKQAAVTDVVIGVLAEEPSVITVGVHVSVALIGGGGILKAKAGAAITAGQLLVPDATDGRVAGVADIAALVANQMAFGIALESAADGEIFEFLAQPIAGPTA